MAYSSYPTSIDDSISLPIITDGVSRIDAVVINRLQDAISKIEEVLGEDPSSTFGSVQARLYGLMAYNGLNISHSDSVVATNIQAINFIGTGIIISQPSSGVILAEINPFQGNTGLPGTQGPQGSPGIQGVQGSPGLTGIVGIQGSPGLTGVQGPTGIQGIQGSPGLTGVTGPIGPDGSQGSPGVTGPRGATGTQGAPGIQGITGVTGIQGVVGPQGAAGDSNGTIATLGSVWESLTTIATDPSNVIIDKPLFSIYTAGTSGVPEIFDFSKNQSIGIIFRQHIDAVFTGMQDGHTYTFSWQQASGFHYLFNTLTPIPFGGTTFNATNRAYQSNSSGSTQVGWKSIREFWSDGIGLYIIHAEEF